MTASPPLQPLPDAVAMEHMVNTDAEQPAKLAFVDLETTGLDPKRHEIWEIALLVGEEELHWYLPVDLTRADADALRISGFYERHPAVRGGGEWTPPGVEETATVIARVTAGAHLAGVNPAFDATFLGAFIRQNGQVPTWHYHLVDVLPLIAGHFRLAPPWDSKDLSAVLRVEPPDGEERHTALGDARWARRMYEAVMS